MYSRDRVKLYPLGEIFLVIMQYIGQFHNLMSIYSAQQRSTMRMVHKPPIYNAPLFLYKYIRVARHNAVWQIVDLVAAMGA